MTEESLRAFLKDCFPTSSQKCWHFVTNVHCVMQNHFWKTRPNTTSQRESTANEWLKWRPTRTVRRSAMTWTRQNPGCDFIFGEKKSERRVFLLDSVLWFWRFPFLGEESVAGTGFLLNYSLQKQMSHTRACVCWLQSMAVTFIPNGRFCRFTFPEDEFDVLSLLPKKP